MSDLSDCCYGMGFGPEGDGVELVRRIVPLRAPYASFGIAEVCKAFGLQQPKKPGSFENIQWPQFTFETKESTAKPSLPALTRQAVEKYKGLGFCDGLGE